MLLQNTTTSTVAAGTPVSIVSTSGFVLANATDTTLPTHGFPDSAVPAGGYCTVRTEGELSLLDWTTPLGSASLTPGTNYYTSATAGKITSTAPSTTGNLDQCVGFALDKHTLRISLPLGVAHA